MTKAGPKKQQKKELTEEVHIEDIDEYENTKLKVYSESDEWDESDPRWGRPPNNGKPTVVFVVLWMDKIQDLDTVRGTVNVRIGFHCRWKDARLEGRSRLDPLPEQLWSPRPTIEETIGDFSQTTRHLALTIGTLEGEMESTTFYEGNIKNPMHLDMFPVDTDTIEITFLASECFKRNGDINLNYKSDYRLYFEGFEAATEAPNGWKLVSSQVSFIRDEDPWDVMQIRLNLTRHFGFYIFKVVIPLVLITCLNFMGFFLETLSERLANNVTLFLSAQALLYVVGQYLPQTPNQTAIDRIVLVTISLIFTTSIHFVYLGRNSKMEILNKKKSNLTNPDPMDKDDHLRIIEDKIDDLNTDGTVFLCYLFGFLAYLGLEFLHLMIRRLIAYAKFRKNVDDENIRLDGIVERNKEIMRDPMYKTPPELVLDPYRIILVKKEHSHALNFPKLDHTKKGIQFLLVLSSGKGIVMSSRPDFKYEEKDVKWVTIGSAFRAIDVIFGADDTIQVHSFTWYKRSFDHLVLSVHDS